MMSATDATIAAREAARAGGGGMSAAVLVAPERLEVRRVPIPEAGAHEVRVRVRAVGLCGTDVHIYAGHANYHRDHAGRLVPLEESPQILGHEIAGEVDAVGAGVADLRPGDRVVVDQGRTCVGERRAERCEYCRSGDSHQCEHYREHGITGLPGGFAEYLVVPGANAVRFGEGLEWEAAALVEPLGCVVHSCELLSRAAARYSLDAADPERRVRTALVLGAGPAGLLFVQYLRGVLGYDGSLLVSEPDPTRRARAGRFGAEAVDPTAVDLPAVVRERSGGRRAELIVEASGSAAAFAAIPELLRKQGTVLLYGHGHAGGDLESLNGVQFLEPTLVSPAGASGGYEPDGRPTTELRAQRLVESGTIAVAPLVTHRYHSLDDLPRALAGEHHEPGYVKAVVTL
jgi:L-iditol 2-dehydrogenase